MNLSPGKRSNRLLGILCFCLISGLLWPAPVFSVSAEVTDISDTKYFDAVHNALQDAKQSIYASLYTVTAAKHDKTSLPSILVQDLIDAHNRGVNVVVRLDGSCDYVDAAGDPVISRKNAEAYLRLTNAAIDCKYAIPAKTLHDKLIVIDQETVIEGSMNWYTRALTYNMESACLIKSPELAQEKIERIKNFELAAADRQDPFQVQAVLIPNRFLCNPAFGGLFVRSKANYAFDTYMFFLRRFEETGQALVDLDYGALIKYLGMDSARIDENRAEINRVLKKLKDKFKLIDCEVARSKPAKITLLDYDDKSKPCQIPQKGYFAVPLAYWEYGWNRKLPLNAKYCYLINVYRTELSDDKPWWSMSVKDIARMFHFSPTTVILGMTELGKQGLLDVEYDEPKDEKTGLFGYREPNKYCLRTLLSQEQIDAGWLGLKMAYTDSQVDNARKLAFMIDKGNDLDAVKSFILITNKYGEKWVAEATRLTAKHRPGRTRSIAYIVGILQNWEKRGDGPK